MGRRNGFESYFEYTSASEVKARASVSKQRMAGQKSVLEPVVVQGRTLVRTWWGQAWIHNLEQYADFSNRLGRGRAYVRAGAVLDLKILPGKIIAKVQGSRVRPYAVEIAIAGLPDQQAKTLLTACSGKLVSLEALMDGSFPKELADLFLIPKKGLFPAPSEISLDCSCPDWASMCKHVAAVLYGVGVRLDEHPDLFFTLRQIDLQAFLSHAIQSHAVDVLAQTSSAPTSERVMDLGSADLASMFGIEIEPSPITEPVTEPKTEPVKRKRGRPRKNP